MDIEPHGRIWRVKFSEAFEKQVFSGLCLWVDDPGKPQVHGPQVRRSVFRNGAGGGGVCTRANGWCQGAFQSAETSTSLLSPTLQMEQREGRTALLLIPEQPSSPELSEQPAFQAEPLMNRTDTDVMTTKLAVRGGAGVEWLSPKGKE